MEFPIRSLTEACVLACIKFLFFNRLHTPGFFQQHHQRGCKADLTCWGAVAGEEQGDKIFQSESCLQSPNVVTQQQDCKDRLAISMLR